MTHTLPITKVRENLTRLVDNAQKKLDDYVITVNGIPAAVLISADEYDSWKETNDILADKKLMKNIKEAENEIEKGKYVTLKELKNDLGIK